MKFVRRAIYRILNIIALLSLISFLYATQPYWSELPSTQTIERHDSLTGFDITKYELTLNINDQTHYITGNAIAHVSAENNLSEIRYELVGGNLAVTEVLVNGSISTYNHSNGILSIPLNITAGQQFTTKVTYSGTPGNSPAPYGIGLKFNANSFYTLSNPDAGRYWWPCYDHPWDKALIDLHITVRTDWLVAANGTRQGIVDNGNGTKTHNWVLNSPVATYVVGIAAGAFVEFNQTAGTVPIQNFVLPNQLANAQADFSNVPEMINFFSSVYGAYPFEKYGHAVVTISPYAAMEHQTMTTFGAQYITGNQAYESTVAHELTHQWFGNSVTPLTMQDVWLKESFATYSEFLWRNHHYGWDSGLQYLDSQIQNYYIGWEDSNGPHTIYNPVYNELFAPPTYEKSASVLHMLRLKLGNTAFFNFVQTWYSTYQNSNVITSEIKDMAEQASGVDLEQFFRQWIYSPGIPSAKLTYFTDGISNAKVIAQTISPTPTQFDVEIPLHLDNSALLDSVVVRATATGYANVFPVNIASDNLSNIQIDPNHWVLSRGYEVNAFTLTQCLPANHRITLNWTELNCPLPLAGYNVYRKELPNSAWTRVNNTPVSGLTYPDHSAQNNTTYQYYVTAVDEQGFETLPTNMMSATPIDFPFDQGLLVVDETRDGTGTMFSPTDTMVDEFYSSTLDGFSYVQWNYATQNAPSLEIIRHYPLILWHSDDYNQFWIDDNIDILNSYVQSGGKLLVSGWKYPSVMPETFFEQWFPMVTPLFVNEATLEAVESDLYPIMHPDSTKLAATWYGKLGMSYVFPGASQVIYTADMSDSLGNGEPIAMRVDNSGTMVLLGFPLYYMQQNEVRAFLHQILPQLYSGIITTNEDNTAPEVTNISCYPNPFSDKLNINLGSNSKQTVRITLFNIKGQKVREWSSVKASELTWDGKDLANRVVSNGIYFIKVDLQGSSGTTKILKLK